MNKTKTETSRRRAVIVGGVRTPFVRAFGPFTRIDAIGLGVAAVRGLLERTGMPWKEIDSLYWGGVILPGDAPNVGREIVLDLGLPTGVEAMTVTRACTSSLLSTTLAAAVIERGDADVIIAGGGDSTSNAEVKMPQSLVHKMAPVVMGGKATAGDYFKLLASISPARDLIPRQPSARERTTGELMGQAAERMAQRWGVGREAQDAFAVQSHLRAAKAFEQGIISSEIVPVDTPEGKRVLRDNIIRGDTSVEKLAKLRPAFKRNGTLTAGNSSALTDGASALLLMSEEKARALGFKPLAAFRSWYYNAVDPADQLLIGPAIAMPRAVQRAGMTLEDIDLIDIHEAFAAQVLCVLKAMGSDRFCRERVGLDKAFGTIRPEDINIYGGSVALGHPFAATGGRMLITMANELARSGKATALLGLCAAGGQAGAAVLEAVE